MSHKCHACGDPNGFAPLGSSNRAQGRSTRRGEKVYFFEYRYDGEKRGEYSPDRDLALIRKDAVKRFAKTTPIKSALSLPKRELGHWVPISGGSRGGRVVARTALEQRANIRAKRGKPAKSGAVKRNPEGLTWKEWFGAATNFGNQPHDQAERMRWIREWMNGVDPTEYAQR
jgi:hypothetical protein